MEARIKRLFSRSFSTSSPSSDHLKSGHLESIRYESAVPQKSPIRGLQSLNAYDKVKRQPRIPSQAPAAEAPPDVVRNSRWDLETDGHRRSRSLDPPPRRSKHSSRTFSGFSMKSPPSLLKRRKQSISSSSLQHAESFCSDVKTPIPPIPKVSLHSRRKSSHVDIFIASSLSHHASGRRDYGEDVADRNITKACHSRQTSDAIFNLDSEEFSYMRSLYIRERAKIHTRDNSRVCSPPSRDHLLKEEGNDDDVLPTSPLSPRPAGPTVTSISSPRRKPKKDRSKKKQSPTSSVQEEQFSDHNSIFVSTTTSVASACQPGNPIIPRKPVIPARSESRTYSFPSKPAKMRETMRDSGPRTKRVLRRSLDKSQWSRGAVENVTSGSVDMSEWPISRKDQVKESTQAIGPRHEAAIAAAAAAVAGNEKGRSEETSETWPLAAPTSVLDKKQSNSPPQKPATTIMDNRPYTPLANSKHNPGSSVNSVAAPKKTRSRTNSSAAYSPFPKTKPGSRPGSRPPYSRQNSQNSTGALPTSPKYKSTRNRPELTMDGSPERPSLKGDIDLGYTADTEVSTRVLPAVTNETIIPKVHKIREEQITREIHTHDVFHRVQPIIQTEILPTKHYIHNNAGNLVEISASAVPGRQGQWQVQESPRSSMSSDSCLPPSIPTSRTQRGGSVSTHQYSGSDQPVMTSTRASTMASGGKRTESIWRHRPTFETGEPEKIEPVAVSPNSHDRSDPYGDETDTSQSRRSEDSALLFRDNGYGSSGMLNLGGGMLPGLLERSPIVDSEGEATRTVRRRNEDLEIQRRMGGMSLK